MVKTKNCYREQISWIIKKWNNIITQNSVIIKKLAVSLRGMDVINYRIKGLSKHFVDNKYLISKLRRKVFM